MVEYYTIPHDSNIQSLPFSAEHFLRFNITKMTEKKG